MEHLFTPEYWLLWAALLGTALFFPVRRLIWMMSVNRAAKHAQGKIEEAEKLRLRRRAGVTAALLCFIFAVLYTYVLFFRQS